MLEKLNGVTEKTNPSKGRTSLEFHMLEVRQVVEGLRRFGVHRRG